MFLTREQIMQKTKAIIADDVDNDVLFVVAHKGIGKTQILNEVYGTSKHNAECIAVDGNRIKMCCSPIKRCFIEGIFEYISRNNSLAVRSKLCEIMGRFDHTSAMMFKNEMIFVLRRKIHPELLTPILSAFTLRELKEIYYKIAKNMPLVIVSAAMQLEEEEIKYLSFVQNESPTFVESKVTFIIGIRATPGNMSIMDRIIKNKASGIWILPMLPTIESKSLIADPKSIASIYIEGIGVVDNMQYLRQKMLTDIIYFETYDIVSHILEEKLDPYCVFLLAKQEISLESFEYIKATVSELYKERAPGYNNAIALQNDGKILWADAISYYLAIQKGLDKAIEETQNFFMKIIKAILQPNQNYLCEKSNKNLALNFLHEAEKIENNALAGGFAKYYADFARLTRSFISTESGKISRYKEIHKELEILDRIVIEYGDDSIECVEYMYDNTQICYILDYGLKVIGSYICNLNNSNSISDASKKRIKQYLRRCALEAYKWHDLTLINEIVKTESMMREKNLIIHFDFDELTENVETRDVYEYFLSMLKEKNLKIGDVIMPKKTIFLSYAHADEEDANRLDKCLQNFGYDVKRDVRDVKHWGDLRAFMRSIRKEDYVVLLVSDTYLRRDNCMYEVMQLLKDESYQQRSFPVVIDFSKEEKEKRSKAGRAQSMFDLSYSPEITLFWQERKDAFGKEIQKIQMEYRCEATKKYGELCNITQSVGEFMNSFFQNELLEVVDDNRENYPLIAEAVDARIQGM